MQERTFTWRYILVLFTLLLALGLTGSVATANPSDTSVDSPTEQTGQADEKQETKIKLSSGKVEAAYPPPAGSSLILYNQYNNQGSNDITSQNFESTNNPYDTFAADDFVVPAGQTWNVDTVEVDGEYTGSGPADSVNVLFYSNGAGNLPGTVVASRDNLTYTAGPAPGDLIIPLGSSVELGPGTWWMSVQANQNLVPAGQWFWRDRTLMSNAGAAWQNPGNGFGTGCTAWSRRTTCVSPGNTEPDQVFRLIGTTCNPSVINGSIVTGDPIQTNRPFRDGIPDTCATPGACGSPFTGSYHYDTYTFTNTTGGSTCVSVNISTACTGTNFIYSAAYLGAFVPSNICNNFLASAGSSPNPIGAYSFTVPAGSSFVVNVHEVTANAGCPAYTLTVSGHQPCTCPMSFSDVQASDWFYEFVNCLYCRGAISGYANGTFRPYNNTTRGQLSKIVVVAFAYPIYTPPTPTFSDVPADHPFYPYVETAAQAGIVSGYADGTFKPGNDVTRGQLSKIVVVAAGWRLLNPITPTFSDVPQGSPFYQYIETAVCHDIVTGYADGTFRPGNNATRSQISKIVCLAVRDEGVCGP
jgi:hypothetical protein